MNVEALITALFANLGDPQDLVRRAEQIDTPQVSGRAAEAFKRKFVLLGRAAANKNVIDFVQRLKASMDAEKEQNEQEKQEDTLTNGPTATAVETARTAGVNESQYKGPSGKHLRSQSFYPASVNPSKSMGGVVDAGGHLKRIKKNTKKKTRSHASENISIKLDEILGLISEEIAVKGDEGTVLAAERGQFVVDGEIVIGNHADILKILVMWLIDNRPEVMQSAVDSIAEMVRTGTVFR